MAELEPPLLLVAMPQVLDPFFHRSVVLLVHHDDEGSLGFIVNHPTAIKVAEILAGMDITWEGDPEGVAFFGGPVQPQLGSILFEQGDAHLPDTVAAIVPGVGVSQHVGDLSRLAADAPGRLRFVLGYAGWGEGQLIEEILRNDWILVPWSQELVFHGAPEKVWNDALKSVGVDPGSLPSWTDGGEDRTN